MLKDFFLLALNNLKRRKLRSWLTMLGIFIGVAAVVSLVSLGQGLQLAITEQFEQVGSDKIIIQPRGRIGPPGSETATSLTAKDLEVIKNVKGVENAAGVLVKTAKIEFDDEVKFNFIIGLPTGKERDLIEEAQFYKIFDGRNLEEKDKFKVVLGNNYFTGNIFTKKVQVRNTITIQGHEFKVIGILDKIGNPFDDGSVLVNEASLKEIYGLNEEVSQILVKVSDESKLEKIAEDITKDLRESRNEKEGKETFEVQTPEQILGVISNVFSVVTIVLAGIAAISLVVGGIGIANTMYTSVLERTREIGIMKAVGAKSSDILSIFLFESGLLGLAGGIIGVLLGIGIGEFIEFIGTRQLGTTLLQASFSPLLIFGTLLFAFLIGAISGILPARQASSLKPIEALRYQ